ncbi:MAG: hypothetical protein JEY91_09460, partial [Spirochaetaceae bacterium]|nr:hypothetical protein [Spirochaetaceae bacterium]
MKRIDFIFVILCLTGSFLWGQNHDEDWFFDEAEKAIEKENYEYAISILEDGRRAYPGSYRIIEKIGDLYFDKDLYSLALETYREGELLEPDKGSILYKVGSTLGRLNENDQAIEYYERLLDSEKYHKL